MRYVKICVLVKRVSFIPLPQKKSKATVLYDLHVSFVKVAFFPVIVNTCDGDRCNCKVSPGGIFNDTKKYTLKKRILFSFQVWFSLLSMLAL